MNDTPAARLAAIVRAIRRRGDLAAAAPLSWMASGGRRLLRLGAMARPVMVRLRGTPGTGMSPYDGDEVVPAADGGWDDLPGAAVLTPLYEDNHRGDLAGRVYEAWPRGDGGWRFADLRHGTVDSCPSRTVHIIVWGCCQLPLAGASVRCACVAQGFDETIVVGADGDALFAVPADDTYTVTITRAGFATFAADYNAVCGTVGEVVTMAGNVPDTVCTCCCAVPIKRTLMASGPSGPFAMTYGSFHDPTTGATVTGWYGDTLVSYGCVDPFFGPYSGTVPARYLIPSVNPRLDMVGCNYITIFFPARGGFFTPEAPANGTTSSFPWDDGSGTANGLHTAVARGAGVGGYYGPSGLLSCDPASWLFHGVGAPFVSDGGAYLASCAMNAVSRAGPITAAE